MKKQLLVDLCKFVGVNPGNLNKKELEAALYDRVHPKIEGINIHKLSMKAATKFIQEILGHTILDTDYDCVAGHADIISMEDGRLNMFVVNGEVSTFNGFRSEPKYDANFRRRMESIMQLWCKQHGGVERPFSFMFNSICVDIEPDLEGCSIRRCKQILGDGDE